MRLSIFGMGYVGCVTAACLIKQGHKVIGVDIIENKVNKLNQGIWPIYEPGLKELNSLESMEEQFFATKDDNVALQNSEILLICVGTPDMPDGKVNFDYLLAVLEKISSFVRKKSKKYYLLIRSTIPPGTTRNLISEFFNSCNDSVQIAFLPEFLREGNAIDDFFSPSLKVVGCEKDFPLNILSGIFPEVKGEWIATEFEVAESIKYINNSWHALKIVFTNEIASILKKYNTNSEKAMEIFCMDSVLNISPNYMRPGFAYGGSCLPKDLNALKGLAKEASVKTPVLDSISESNIELINRLETFIYSKTLKNLGFCGVSFKPNTDDIRNSPIAYVIKELLSGKRSYQKKFNIMVCDSPEVVEKLGEDKDLEKCIVNNIDEIAVGSDIIILGPYKISEELILNMLEDKKILIDLKWHPLGKRIKSHTNYYTLV